MCVQKIGYTIDGSTLKSTCFLVFKFGPEKHSQATFPAFGQKTGQPGLANIRNPAYLGIQPELER